VAQRGSSRTVTAETWSREVARWASTTLSLAGPFGAPVPSSRTLQVNSIPTREAIRLYQCVSARLSIDRWISSVTIADREISVVIVRKLIPSQSMLFVMSAARNERSRHRYTSWSQAYAWQMAVERWQLRWNRENHNDRRSAAEGISLPDAADGRSSARSRSGVGGSGVCLGIGRWAIGQQRSLKHGIER